MYSLTVTEIYVDMSVSVSYLKSPEDRYLVFMTESAFESSTSFGYVS